VQLPFVSGLLVLDADGGRVAVKYFDPSILGGAAAASATAAAGTPAGAATPAAATAPAIGSAAAAKAQEAQLKAELSFEKKVFAKTVRNQRQDGYDTIRTWTVLQRVALRPASQSCSLRLTLALSFCAFFRFVSLPFH
jgi:hypothetical protein